MSYNHQYDSPHKWLTYHHGKAVKCENTNCENTSKTYQWALLKGKKHAKVKENYQQMCRQCHSRYDKVIERMTELKYIPVTAYKDGKLVGVYSSCKVASELLGISRPTISNVIRGKQKTAKGHTFIKQRG